MTPTARPPEPRASYWYPDDAWAQVGTLEAVRSFLRADEGMRRRLQREMDMNETDLRAVRVLASAERDGRTISPRELSDALEISTASTTKLLDRLEKDGRLRPVRHPTDRRGLRIELTKHVHTEVHDTLGPMHQRMRAVVDALSPEEARTVSAFLGAMGQALADEDDESAAQRPSRRSRVE
jgi:DNA-binding MarR family transcriptional regulator